MNLMGRIGATRFEASSIQGTPHELDACTVLARRDPQDAILSASSEVVQVDGMLDQSAPKASCSQLLGEGMLSIRQLSDRDAPILPLRSMEAPRTGHESRCGAFALSVLHHGGFLRGGNHPG